MSKRKVYRPGEVKAGHTLFIVGAHFDHQARRQYGVMEYLVASKREPQPEPGVVHPYRMHPDIAQYAGTCTDLWMTRRAAQAEADRRQALEDAA